MSKDKILRVVLPVAAAVVVVCVLCILFLTQCRSGGEDAPVIDPDSTSPTTASTVVDDVEVSDRKDFDWRSESGESFDKDDSFNNIANESKPSDTSTTTKNEENGNGLRHDESKNQGQEADFSSFGVAQP